jgi:hypothetical protein
VISVILRPCDWRETPLAHFLVTPTDGKAVVKWSNQDEAFQDIVKSIRNAIPKPPSTATTNPLSSPTLPLPARSSNLRIKKSFTQADQERVRGTDLPLSPGSKIRQKSPLSSGKGP